MQGFDQMWQNGIGFTATSIWQVPFRFCRGFSTATILDRGDLKILGFCSVTLSLKKTGQKVTSLVVMVHKLARKPGLQPAPICKQTLQNAWCLRKLESLQATCWPVLSFLKYENMCCFFTSFSRCWAVPTYVDIQLDKKGEKSTEAWTCAKFNVNSLWLLPFPKLSESHWEFPSWTPQQALFSIGKALGQSLRGNDPHGT